MQGDQPGYFFNAYIDGINIALSNRKLQVKNIVNKILNDNRLIFEGEFIPYHEVLGSQLDKLYERCIEGRLNHDGCENRIEVWVPEPKSKQIIPYIISIKFPNQSILEYLSTLLSKSKTKSSLSQFKFIFDIFPKPDEKVWEAKAFYSWLRNNTILKYEIQELSERNHFCELYGISQSDASILEINIYPGSFEDQTEFIRMEFVNIKPQNKFAKQIPLASLNNAYFRKLIGEYMLFKDSQFHNDFHASLKNINLI
jgi:hypothetical protein